jgi:hypothetical protein
LWRSLRHPSEVLRELDAGSPSLRALPYGAWAVLVLVAVGGSCLYGGSLALVLPSWKPERGAAWLALSAGLAWCVFGPALALATRRSPFTCAHACLVTMAYGEGVLLLGAAANVILALAVGRGTSLAPVFNLAWVLLANGVMAWTLAVQFRALGVPVRKTLFLWMVLLNGSGAAFAWVFARLLGGGG